MRGPGVGHIQDPRYWQDSGDLKAEVERLRAAILDIDAHATPMGEDQDGFVAGGYLISVGCLHGALALAGTAPRCADCEGHDAHDLRAANQDMWNAMQYARNHPENWQAVIGAALDRHRSQEATDGR